MPVLERSELEASPLADLHAIADQVGVDGFKRLRKADLIDKILAVQGGGEGSDTDAGEPSADGEEAAKPARKRRLIRPRRGSKRQESDEEQAEQDGAAEADEPPVADGGADEPSADEPDAEEASEDAEPEARTGSRSSRSERGTSSRSERGTSSRSERGTSSRSERGTSSRSERPTSSSRGRRGDAPRRRSGPPRASSRCCQTALRSCAWIRPSSRPMTSTSHPLRFAAVSSSAATA